MLVRKLPLRSSSRRAVAPSLASPRHASKDLHAAFFSSSSSFSSVDYLSRARQRQSFANDVTVNNLKLTKDTRVIIQGFTGRQGTFDAEHSLAYGTKIVGGVRPGKDGEHLGLPVLPSVRAAMDALKPDATAVYVAAGHAAGAITEAIEAEVPLVVAVAEHIPLHEMLRIQQVLKTQSKTRLVGANTPGMINPHARCRIGFPPIPFFKPGNVAIAAKSGTLSYETVASTTRAGLGQSMSIGIGGDPLPGTDFVDCLRVFEEDVNTEGIILVGELGGFAEEHAAEWIKDYRKRVKNPKPIAALIGGIDAVPGRIMGHAGSISSYGEPTAADKIKHLEEAGVVVTDHPSKFGEVMRDLLANRSSGPTNGSASIPKLRDSEATSPPLGKDGSSYSFAIALDRKEKNLRLVGWNGDGEIGDAPFNYAFEYTSEEGFRDTVNSFLGRLYPRQDWASTNAAEQFAEMRQLHSDEMLRELTFTLEPSSNPHELKTEVTSRVFDDAAYKSSKRAEELYAKRTTAGQEGDPAEAAAEKHGIVYVKLGGGTEMSIGTLANGAGLAMNLVDAIEARGGKCANFLDTGGKATSETVKMSFDAILKDERVRVIFVNIFGGLTLGDMIANGIILAYKDLGISKPVVVRLRGTNEKEGQKLLAESGLPIYAYDDFEEAAAKAIELAGQKK